MTNKENLFQEADNILFEQNSNSEKRLGYLSSSIRSSLENIYDLLNVQKERICKQIENGNRNEIKKDPFEIKTDNISLPIYYMTKTDEIKIQNELENNNLEKFFIPENNININQIESHQEDYCKEKFSEENLIKLLFDRIEREESSEDYKNNFRIKQEVNDDNLCMDWIDSNTSKKEKKEF